MTTTEPTGSAQPLPAVTLDFSNKSGGAWDDRELVNAYDAALLEFHVRSSSCGVTDGYSGHPWSSTTISMAMKNPTTDFV